MAILELIEKLINERGSSAILKERLQLISDRVAQLEREKQQALDALAAEQAKSGPLDWMNEVRPTYSRTDHGVLLPENPRGEATPMDLGYGVVLSVSATEKVSGLRMSAFASSWVRYGKSQEVRSGWFFFNDFPIREEDYFETRTEDDLRLRNMAHAAVFFKLHVSAEGRGRFHMASVSNYPILVNLATSRGARLGSLLQFEPVDASRRRDDVFIFDCEPTPVNRRRVT